jgi:hypothetical protein
MRTMTMLLCVLVVGCAGLTDFGLASQHKVRWGEIARADRTTDQPTAKAEPEYVATRDHAVWQYFHDRGRDFNKRDWEVVTWYAHLSRADRRQVDAESGPDDAHETLLPDSPPSLQPMADVWPSMALAPTPLYPIVQEPTFNPNPGFTCRAYKLGGSSSATDCLWPP